MAIMGTTDLLPVRSLGKAAVTSVTSSLVTRTAQLGISSPPLVANLSIPMTSSAASFLQSSGSSSSADVGGPDMAYTQGQADAAANKLPVTLIAAGVGAVAIAAFVFMQTRKKRR